MKSLAKLLILVAPVVMFVVWVWLLFVKFQKDVVVEIEDLIAKNKWSEAVENIEKVLHDSDNPQVHLYVFGTVAKFGLEEEANKSKSARAALKKTRDYNYEIIRHDSTGIYLRESFFYRFKKFPKTKKIVKLLCDYLDYFPSSLENEEKIQNLFLTFLYPNINWRIADPSCLEQIFSKDWLFLKPITLSPKKKSSPMRNLPDNKSKIMRFIQTNEKVLIRKKPDENNVNNTREIKWIYVMDRLGKSGWVSKKQFSNIRI